MVYFKLVVTGVIKNGVVVPEGELPLPEGTKAEIVFSLGYDELLKKFGEKCSVGVHPDAI